MFHRIRKNGVQNLQFFGQNSDISTFNPLMHTLKPYSNRPSYCTMVIGTLVFDGWAVTFGTTRRGLGGLQPRPVLSTLYQMLHCGFKLSIKPSFRLIS